MSEEEYSVEVTTNNYTIEVDTSSDNLASSVTIEISDPVSNTVEVNTGLAGSIVYASDVVGLTDFILAAVQDPDSGVITHRQYINVDNDTYLTQESQVVFVNSELSDISVYLPSASGFGGGEILVKNIGNGSVTVIPSGISNIDGQGSFTLNYGFESFSFISNNSNWYII